MEALHQTAARIAVYPLEDRDGSVRHEFNTQQAIDSATLAALPAHIRTRVEAVLRDPKPGFEILRDGAVHPPYAVVVNVDAPGTADLSEFARCRVDLAATFDATRMPQSSGW